MRHAIRTGLVGLLLAVVVLGSASPEPWSSRHAASYESGPRPLTELLPADAQPLWAAALTAQYVSALDGMAYAFVADGLTAFDVTSGDVIWRRTHSSPGPLLATADGLFAAAGDTLLKLDSRTGVIVWQRQLSHGEIRSLHHRSDRILVMGSMWHGGDLLDTESGEVVYGLGITDNAWPVYLDDSILYIREYSGEPHFYHSVLHDLEAGEQRWWLGHSDGPIFRSDGHAYFVRQHLHRSGPQDVRVVDEQSGQVVAAWQYSSGEANARLSDFAPHWIMTGEYVAALSGAQDMVLGFPWGGANEPAWTLELGGSYRAGPVNGVIIAESPDGRLSATSVQGRTSVKLLGPGAAFTRIDMIGTDVYAVRQDGTLYGVDTVSGDVLARLQLGSSVSGPIVVQAEYLLVHAGDALQIFEY